MEEVERRFLDVTSSGVMSFKNAGLGGTGGGARVGGWSGGWKEGGGGGGGCEGMVGGSEVGRDGGEGEN